MVNRPDNVSHPLSTLATPPPNLLSILLVAAFLVLPACSNEYQEEAIHQVGLVAEKAKQLASDIARGRLSNVVLIRTYAELLARQKPELEKAARRLGLDATIEGPIYQSLMKRLSQINAKPENKAQFAATYEELQSLSAAFDRVLYNDSLMDVVNTLSDLSDGKLARINIPKQADTAAVKGGAVPGSYLVGNPSYGRWGTHSSGGSFWQWYGPYLFFNSMLGGGRYYGGPVFYNTWHSRPRYSYYQDYGRRAYGTSSDRRAWDTGSRKLARQGVRTARPKSYASAAGAKRVSTYASARSRATSNLRAGRMPSGGAAKRTSSFFGSSSRGTSSRARRGK